MIAQDYLANCQTAAMKVNARNRLATSFAAG